MQLPRELSRTGSHEDDLLSGALQSFKAMERLALSPHVPVADIGLYADTILRCFARR